MNSKQLVNKLVHIFTQPYNQTNLKEFEDINTKLSEKQDDLSDDHKNFIIKNIIQYMRSNKTSISVDGKIALLSILCKILNTLTVDPSGCFIIIHNYLKEELVSQDEDYLMSIVKVMTILYGKFNQYMIECFYRKSASYLIPEVLGGVKEILLKSPSIELRKSVLRFLEVYLRLDETDMKIRFNVANTFTFFVPGIVTSLKICCDDPRLFELALDTLRRFIVLIAENESEDCSEGGTIPRETDTSDKIIEAILTQNNELTDTFTQVLKIREKINNAKRTNEWYNTLDMHVSEIVKSFNNFTVETTISKRRRVVHLCLAIVKKCWRNLKRSVEESIKIASILYEDKDNWIFALGTIKGLNDMDDRDSVLENIMGYVITIAEDRKTLIYSGKKTTVKLLIQLTGYIHVLEVCSAYNIFKSKFLTLQLIETIEKLFEHLRKPGNTVFNSKRTKYDFHDAPLFEHLRRLIIAIGSFDLDHLVFNEALCKFNDSGKFPPYLIMILFYLASGCKCPPFKRYKIVSEAVKIAVDETLWNDCTYHIEKKNSKIIAYTIITGFKYLAAQCGQNFRGFLGKVVYMLLEQIGSDWDLLATEARETLDSLHSSCRFTNTAALISFCSQHILHRIRTDWKVKEKQYYVSRIIHNIMSSNIDEIEIISIEIIEMLLPYCARPEEIDNPYHLIQIFKVFLEKINFPPCKKLSQTLVDIYDKDMSNLYALYIAPELTEEEVLLTAQEMYHEDQLARETIQKKEKKKEENNELPRILRTVESIIEAGINFLAHRDDKWSNLWFKIIALGLSKLGDYEDSLLPLIHRIWMCLEPKIKRCPRLIPPIYMEVLGLMCTLSGDFLRSRVLKDLMPYLLKKMNQNYSISIAMQSPRNSHLCTEFLRVIPNIVVSLELPPELVMEILTLTKDYLQDDVSVSLRNVAEELMRSLAKYKYEVVREHLVVLEGTGRHKKIMKKWKIISGRFKFL